MAGKGVAVLAAAIGVSFCAACGGGGTAPVAERSEPMRQDRYVMGTMAQVSVEGGSLPLLDKVFDELHRFERDLAIATRDSSPLRLSAIKTAERYRAATSGAFDARIANLTKLWRFETLEPRIPSSREINAALLAREKEWDFGGIGKGMAVDAAIDLLREAGVSSAIVNLGGNLRTIGSPRARSEWRIGIRHPRNPEGALGTIELASGMAAATSGDYERFIISPLGNGDPPRRLHHILDPQTGRPAERSRDERRVVSVTIVAVTATEADAWSTGAFVLGWPDGFDAIEKDPGLEGVFVLESGEGRPLETKITSGMKFHEGE